MKNLQRKVQPVKGKMEPKPKRKKTRAAAPAEVEEFTALELEAAEQLVRLSESSVSLGTLRVLPVAPCVALSGQSSSPPRSTKAPPAPPASGAIILGGSEDWEEDEEHEVAGRQRRVKRYRLISEIYAATEPIGERTGSKQNKKRE
ncbi:unnamed protein product [Triticum turgidum subsp. durum]|uniref:Uncharacterized protein n=1 Tax=Triticum turgidum subsp. durum TaxID=4567 RepID=A0A9R1APE5_TRITD|nr:unnamed protein product [Triticum turgidum subsp. durum]